MKKLLIVPIAVVLLGVAYSLGYNVNMDKGHTNSQVLTNNQRIQKKKTVSQPTLDEQPVILQASNKASDSSQSKKSSSARTSKLPENSAPVQSPASINQKNVPAEKPTSHQITYGKSLGHYYGNNPQQTTAQIL